MRISTFTVQDTQMSKSTNMRNKDLARIHIARKDLNLDEDTYRMIIRDIGKVPSCSSADLNAEGRGRVLAHFKSKGWKPRPRGKAKQRTTHKAAGMASDAKVRLIRHIWIVMADAGEVKVRSESGLRAWVKSASRHYHPAGVGYSAPEFLPNDVADNLIEQLKNWCTRCDITVL